MSTTTFTGVAADVYLVTDTGHRFLVDGGWQEQIDYETVRVGHLMKPDPTWYFKDAKGHPHTWDRITDNGRSGDIDSTYVDTYVVSCDGTCGMEDCGGYTTRVRRCTLCHEGIQPGHIHIYDTDIVIAATRSVKVAIVLSDGLLPDVVKGAHLEQEYEPGATLHVPLPPEMIPGEMMLEPGELPRVDLTGSTTEPVSG